MGLWWGYTGATVGLHWGFARATLGPWWGYMGCGEAKGLWCGCAWAMVGLLHWGLGMATLGVWWDYIRVVLGLH